MKTTRAVFCFFLLAAALHGRCASAVNIDSLLHAARQEKDLRKRTDQSVDALYKYMRHNIDSALLLIDGVIADNDLEGFEYGMGRAKSLKAWMLCFKAEYEQALRLGHEARLIQLRLKDTFGLASTLNRIGLTNVQFKRYRDAETYINRSLAFYIMLRDSAKIEMTLNNLGVVASEEKKPLKAISYFKRSLRIREAMQDFFWMAYSYFNIGEAFAEAGNLDSAAHYMQLAIHTFSNKTATGYVPGMVLQGMAALYHEKGDDRKALPYAEAGYADAKKLGHRELEIEGSPLLADILSGLGRFEEAYRMQKQYLEMKSASDSTNNVERVAEIESKYKTAEKEAEIAQLKAEKLEAENETQRLRFYAVIIAAIVLVGILVFVFQMLRRNQREKIRRSELNAKIAETKMFALRAQMNPHFIFNCINTAQHFVISGQKESAYEYLSNFAALLRLVMENSSHTYVPLEDEIRQLSLYTSLEAIRFNNRFTYTLHIDPQLQNGVYEIPGMIIQPVVENAIGHGLINRNDDKGELTVSLKKEGDLITCEVTDNGVGRTQAAAIKAGKDARYRPAAIPNIRERLDILQDETRSRINITITDLQHSDGRPAGTRVILAIPYR